MQRRQFISYSLAATSVGSMSFAQDATDSPIEEIVLGNPDAAVTMIEYASFTCPHCARFHADVMPKIKSEYIDTGKIKFIYREVFFDRPGLWGAMIARCAGNDKYMGIADMLYSRQREWTSGTGGAEIAQNLYKIGRIAGLKNEVMEACLQDQDMAKALVANFQKQAEADGVNSTPSVLINGVNHGNKPFAEFKTLLDAQLES